MVPNTMSMLHDLLPAAVVLAENDVDGLFHLTNPGTISNADVLSMYAAYRQGSGNGWHVNPVTDFREQESLLQHSPNCALDSTKLVNQLRLYNHEIPNILHAWTQFFLRTMKPQIYWSLDSKDDAVSSTRDTGSSRSSPRGDTDGPHRSTHETTLPHREGGDKTP